MKPESVGSVLLSPLWPIRGALPHNSAAQRCCSFRMDRWRARSAADVSKLKSGPKRAKRCARAKLRSITFRSLPRKQAKKEWFAEEQWIYLLMLLTEFWFWVFEFVVPHSDSKTEDRRPKTQDPRPKTKDQRPKTKNSSPNPFMQESE